MDITSTLPLSYLAFAHWHTDDTEVGVVVAKAAFQLTKDGTHPMPEPPALDLVDQFADDPGSSALIREQDIAPHKPKTDLILRGTARSLEGTPRRDWPVSITIPDVLTYGFHVRGPAIWRKHLRRWQLAQPDPVTEVPLSYAYAYGGNCMVGEDTQFFEQNPAGQGYMTEEAAHERAEWSAPQIGLLAEFMDARPFVPMSVQGTMPVAKGWLPRRARAGTFDAAWEQDRHPRMPLDYDLGFWNAAPLGMQIEPYLAGDETIEISGVSHQRATVTLRLPGARLALQSHITDEQLPMVLDTVDIDVETIDDGYATMTLLWRALVPDRDAFAKADIVRG